MPISDNHMIHGNSNVTSFQVFRQRRNFAIARAEVSQDGVFGIHPSSNLDGLTHCAVFLAIGIILNRISTHTPY